MNIKKYIPNTITCCSLVSGCIASVTALQGDLYGAAVWILLAALFDFLDGFAARLLQAFSPIGKELDSLSDQVSFGVAPGMMLFTTLREAVATLSWGTWTAYLPYLAFVIPAFSALRLAKFNIDSRQTTSFIGLPVPAHAIFWASALYAVAPAIKGYEGLFLLGVLPLSFLSSWLLVSELPMFSLKVKSLAWHGNEVRYILIAGTLLFVVAWGFLGLAGAILLYVALSIFNKRR